MSKRANVHYSCTNYSEVKKGEVYSISCKFQKLTITTKERDRAWRRLRTHCPKVGDKKWI